MSQVLARIGGYTFDLVEPDARAIAADVMEELGGDTWATRLRSHWSVQTHSFWHEPAWTQLFGEIPGWEVTYYLVYFGSQVLRIDDHFRTGSGPLSLHRKAQVLPLAKRLVRAWVIQPHAM